VGTGVFTVVVLSADQMIGNLIAAEVRLPQASSLLQNAASSTARNNVSSACGQMTAFVNQVQAQTGKSLTRAQAADLLSRAADVKATLGCR